MKLTFDQLPEAVEKLAAKLESIETLLLSKNAQIPEADELLNIQQTADLLNLAVPTIYGLVSKSEIPVSKLGKKLYFSKQEILCWVKSGRKKTNAELQAEADNYLNGKRR